MDKLYENFLVNTPEHLLTKTGISKLLNLYVDFLNVELSNDLINIFDVEYLEKNNLNHLKERLFKIHLQDVYETFSTLELERETIDKFKKLYDLYKLDFSKFGLNSDLMNIPNTEGFIKSSKDYNTKKGTKNAFIYIDSILSLLNLNLEDVQQTNLSIDINTKLDLYSGDFNKILTTGEPYNYTINSNNRKGIIGKTLIPLCHPVGFCWNTIKTMVSTFEDYFGYDIQKNLSYIGCGQDNLITEDYRSYQENLDYILILYKEYLLEYDKKTLEIKKYVLPTIEEVELKDNKNGIIRLTEKGLDLQVYSILNLNSVDILINNKIEVNSFIKDKTLYNYKLTNKTFYSFEELYYLFYKKLDSVFYYQCNNKLNISYDIKLISNIDDTCSLNEYFELNEGCQKWFIGQNKINDNNLFIDKLCQQLFLPTLCKSWLIGENSIGFEGIIGQTCQEPDQKTNNIQLRMNFDNDSWFIGQNKIKDNNLFIIDNSDKYSYCEKIEPLSDYISDTSKVFLGDNIGNISDPLLDKSNFILEDNFNNWSIGENHLGDKNLVINGKVNDSINFRTQKMIDGELKDIEFWYIGDNDKNIGEDKLKIEYLLL